MAASTPTGTTPAVTPRQRRQIVLPPLPGDYDFFDYEDSLTTHTNMFGSLMAVSKANEETTYALVENWWKIINKWYPNLHREIMCIPPLHFNSVSYDSKCLEKMKAPAYTPDHPQYCWYGFRTYQPSQYSKIKDDEAQQRVLWTVSEFLKFRNSQPRNSEDVPASFILSNMEFQNFLNKKYTDPNNSCPEYVKPKMPQDEGEIDVLVIDKDEGVFVLEVKAIHPGDDARQVDEATRLNEMSVKLMKLAKQVPKQKKVVKQLLDVLDPNLKVRSAIVLANTPRKVLEETMAMFPMSATVLSKALEVTSAEAVSACTFCSDDLPAMNKEGGVDCETLSRFQSVWKSVQDKSEPSTRMSKDLYEHIVALFCGPLTTVKICTEKTMPRVCLTKTPGKGKFKREKITVTPIEVRTQAGAARECARRFSELILQQPQIDILQQKQDFVHLEGPPGTGKTLMLLLRILTWLDDGHKVWVISYFPPSRSVTHVLFEQAKRMLEVYYNSSESQERMKRLHMFILTRPKETLDENYFERRLYKFRDRAKYKVAYQKKNNMANTASAHDKKVCLVVDESGMTGEGLHEFFTQVAVCYRNNDFCNKRFAGGLCVWSASVERVGRPCYVAKPGNQTPKQFGVLWKLKMPLRCPPTVQRALMLVQPSLNRKNICFFKKENMLAHPAHPMEDKDVKDPTKEGRTGEYNQYPAEGLEVFLIAHGNHKGAGENVWFCKDCGTELAIYLKNVLKIGSPDCVMSDVPLDYKDVMIVATQEAFQFSMPIAGFMYGMKKQGLKVAVNTTREEGGTALTDNDTILIMDMTSVHGLERAVVIIVPEVHPAPRVPSLYKTYFTDADAYDKIPDPKKLKISDSNPLKEVLEEAGDKDVSWSAAGDFTKEDDMESVSSDATSLASEPMDEGEGGEGGGGEGDQGGMRPAVPEDMEVDQPTHLCDRSDYTDLKYTETDSEEEEEEASSKGAPSASGGGKKSKDKLRFADSYSEVKIKAALASLSEQSRKDVFYIGSRAVCQMILIHLAKDPPSPCPQSEEAGERGVKGGAKPSD